VGTDTVSLKRDDFFSKNSDLCGQKALAAVEKRIKKQFRVAGSWVAAIGLLMFGWSLR
jgi:hypothetical protein